MTKCFGYRFFNLYICYRVDAGGRAPLPGECGRCSPRSGKSNKIPSGEPGITN